jgi:hypothetical protein
VAYCPLRLRAELEWHTVRLPGRAGPAANQIGVQHETDHLLGEPYIDALAVDRRRHTMRLLRNRPV